MNGLNALKSVLAELAKSVGNEIPLIVAGGFGLYLRQEHLRQSGDRTLFSQLPEPRATSDIDMFVTMEVLVEVELVKRLRRQIERMGFSPVSGAEYFQWKRIDEHGHETKIDVLCGPLGEHEHRLRTNSLPRVRPKAPKGTLKFHARFTEEAIEVESRAVRLPLAERDTSGAETVTTVYTPHPFSYLMMKLVAFDDRKHDERKDVGRHHAMDLYRIIAMMTQSEYEETLLLGKTYSEDARFNKVQQIVANHFASPSDLGVIRLREHALFQESFPVHDFIEVLAEVFAGPP